MTPVSAIHQPAVAPLDVARLLAAIAAVESGNHMAKIGLRGERSAWQLTRRAWSQVSTRDWSDAFDRKAAEEVAGAYVRYLAAEITRRGEEATPYRVALAFHVGMNGLRSDAALAYARRVQNLYETSK